MTRYRPDALPVACLDCGGRIVYRSERFAWTHVVPTIDHAPRPVGSVQAREAAEARRKAAQP